MVPLGLIFKDILEDRKIRKGNKKGRKTERKKESKLKRKEAEKETSEQFENIILDDFTSTLCPQLEECDTNGDKVVDSSSPLSITTRPNHQRFLKIGRQKILFQLWIFKVF